MKQIFKSTFWQLLVVYVILIALVSFKLLWNYTMHFEVFALVLAGFSLFLISKEDIRISKFWIILPIFIILLIKILPYINNPIPLGYDPGIYKYAIEQPRADEWIKSTFEPGFFSFTSILHSFGFTTNDILIPLFIFLTLLLGLMIYITTKKFFNQDIAILSFLIYSVSIIQFKVFSYFYYRNVLALILLLLTFYLIKSNNYFFILTASFLGGIHRPTFLIFALTFIVYTLINKQRIKNILIGTSIILLTLPFYIHNLKELLLQNLEPLITANIGAGTFINFLQYQFSTLIYLPFSLMGLIHLIKNKEFNLLSISTILLGVIIYFQLIFFNRFLIHLDIFLIILAGYGLYLLIQNKKKLGIILTIILLISAFYINFNQAINAKPLISQEELEIIGSLNNTEENAFVMATSSYYSPWLQGYSNRKVIAPGLFDYNKWDYAKWNEFWNSTSSTKTIQMLKDYEKPLYIFIGRHQRLNLNRFNNKCFEEITNKNNTTIYKLKC